MRKYNKKNLVRKYVTEYLYRLLSSRVAMNKTTITMIVAAVLAAGTVGIFGAQLAHTAYAQTSSSSASSVGGASDSAGAANANGATSAAEGVSAGVVPTCTGTVVSILGISIPVSNCA